MPVDSAARSRTIAVKRGGRSGSHGYLFEITGGEVCLDLANTVDNRPTLRRRELLNSYQDLVDWAEQAGAISASAAARARRLGRQRTAAARATLRRARAAREAMFALFSALAGGRQPPAEALAALNAALPEAMAQLRLGPRGTGCQWSWAADEPSLDRVFWPAVRSAAMLATSDRCARIRECAAHDCSWLFLDRSRNGTRRWCDMTVCGNRVKARRFAARARASRQRERTRQRPR